MGYFDDFELLNVCCSVMYGPVRAERIFTRHHYLGLMQGEVFVDDNILEKRPFVYFVPANTYSLNGWNAPLMKKRINFYIECRGERADKFFAALGASEHFKYYTVSNSQVFYCVLEKMQTIFNRSNARNQAETVLCFEEFAALLENEINSAELPENHAAFDRIMAEIRKNPGAEFNFAANAASMNITLRHWNRLFSNYAKMPPYRFVCKCRAELAGKLLADKNIPIKNIAEECGFANVSDFSRFFKNQSGMTPGAFRKSRLH